MGGGSIAALNIVVAFADEARPLIDLLSLRARSPVAQAGDETFPLYARDEVRLVVTGLGARNAEAATRWLCARCASDAATVRWLNFGIAGSAQFDIGELALAHGVRKQSSGEHWRCHRPPSRLPEALVRTVEQPERDYAQAGVYDMEASGICRALAAGGELVCVKLITDGPRNPLSRMQMKTVRAMLAAARPQLAALLREL